MDMREMVGKVKKGEPLYGHSTLTEYMQGVASRQSRYSGIFLHVMPWFNFVNHNQVSQTVLMEWAQQASECTNCIFLQHGVDTAKYYQQAERELAAEGK